VTQNSEQQNSEKQGRPPSGPASGNITIRPLRPDDDLDALADLQVRAFGPALDRASWLVRVREQIGDGRHLAAFDGSRLAASAAFHDMRQWWLGRAVPMAGVAAVKVAPEDRGRGVGRALMTELLQLIAARGYPVSMLYPSTMPLYRSLGWELAGWSYEADVPATSLRTIEAGQVPLRRATPDDAATVIEVLGAAHAAARDCGPLTRDEAYIRRRLADRDLFAYLAADGYLAYRWRGGNREIHVDRAVALSGETSRALWAVVAGHATIARTVRVAAGPADPLALLLREPDSRITGTEVWMLRVADAPAAVAARGFPPGLDAAVPLRLEDPLLPGNAGDWTLSLAGGRGLLERSITADPANPLTLGARGFSALFAGTPVQALRRAGLAGGGDPGTDALLDTGFAATPFCLDHF
jgi:predicted acetyltransferase